MRYIKKYEKFSNFFKKKDFHKILTEHIVNFIVELNIADVHVQYDNLKQIFVTSKKEDHYRMLLNIQSDNYDSYICLLFVNYDEFMVCPILDNVINYLKETFKEYSKVDDYNGQNNYKFYIKKSDIDKLIKVLNVENYELFDNMKKYNL